MASAFMNACSISSFISYQYTASLGEESTRGVERGINCMLFLSCCEGKLHFLPTASLNLIKESGIIEILGLPIA
jgi:hypothetical protein